MTMQVTSIRWLEDLDGSALPEAGGKGANLGEMVRAGLPVPPGFVVTASAYRAVLEANGLCERIAERLQADIAQPEALADTSREIRAWIEAARVSEDIRVEIAEAYAELTRRLPAAQVEDLNLPVAVRSSATAEDLPSASFAGQQETFLHIVGEEAVLAHVQHCWASLWTPQAISYRASMGFEHLDVALAVVVQAMVPAEVAGVMFTANPVTGRRDELLISASYGLGESVVSGSVTPDTFVLAPDGTLRQRTLGAKEHRILPNDNGTRTEPVRADERARFCLTQQDLTALAALARRVQAHYNSPQDTEWALGDGKLYLLQARPITTLPEQQIAAGSITREQPLNRKVSGVKQIIEYWPEPTTPLDLSFFRDSAAGTNALYRMFGMRPARNLPEPVERSDGRVGVRITNPKLSPALLWTIPARLLFTRGDPLERWRPVATEMERTLARWQTAQQAAEDAPALARLIVQEMREFGVLLGQRFEAVFFSGIKYLLLVKLWARLAGGKTGAAKLEDRLMRAVPFRTALQNQAVTHLAQTAAKVGKDSPQFAAALADFMAEWGTRPASSMVTMPSTPVWREDPAQVLGLVDALLSDSSTLDPDADMHEQEADYRAAQRQVEATLRAPLRKLYRSSLERARNGLIAREDSLFQMERLMAAMRQTVLLFGERLARDGILAEPKDVFFLLATELEPAARGDLAVAERVDRRRRGYAQIVAAHGRGEHWLVASGSIAPPPARKRRPAKKKAADNSTTLAGLAASGGHVSGPVCIIRGPHEFSKMRKGAVLVAPFTAPVWTPLFRLASAVVTEIGSPVSHAAIVAREYGIPAVVAVPQATSALHDGQMVQVDGTRGVVTIIKEATQ